MSAFLILTPLIILLTGIPLGVLLVKQYDRKRNPTQYKFYNLTFPNDLKLEQVIDWFGSVASTFASSSVLPAHKETIVIELRADSKGIKHRLGVPWQNDELVSQLRTQIKGIAVEEMTLESLPDWTHGVEAGVRGRALELDVDSERKIASQAGRILTAASHDLKPGEAVAIQVIVNSVGRVSALQEPLMSLRGTAGFLVGIQPKGPDEAEKRAKLAQNQFKVVLRVVASAVTEARASKKVNNVRNAYRALNTDRTYLKPTSTTEKSVIRKFNATETPIIYPAQVSALELSALSTFPIGSPVVAGERYGRTQFLPPSALIPLKGRVLGRSVYGEYGKRPIAISAEGGTRHVYVIGPSGLGKTTLLANMLTQDIENGYGVVVVESKGDLFEDAKDRVPWNRINDVIVMNLADGDYPVGLNLLQEGGPRIVDDLTNLFASGSSDIYLRDVMYHGLTSLRHFDNMTLVDLLPFLNPQTPLEKSWRDSLIERLPRTGELQQYWKTFDTYSTNEKRQRIQPVVNRIWELTNRREIRNMLGQSKSTISLKDIMEKNKLLFIYVPDSLGDNTVSLLTSLIFKASWDAVRTVKKELPTYMYFDEVQKLKGFVDLAETLSLARSYKLGLVMAHQYTDQLPPKLFSAITNASTQIAFKLDGPDAHRMQGLFGKTVTPDDFMNLEPYEVIARVAIDGGSSNPTVIRTAEPFKPHGFGREVVRRSRAQFSRPAKDVDQEIQRRRSAPSKTEKKRERTFGTRVKEKGDE